MRVGFDIRPLIFTKAGISTYLYNLVVTLAKISKDQFFLFNSSKSSIEWEKNFNNIKEIIIRFPHLNIYFEKFWQEFFLPLGIKNKRVHIFHGPRFFVPKKLSCPSVVAIHDVAFKKFPHFVTKKGFKYFDNLVKNSAVYSSKIIVPSENTKKDLRELYNAPEEKIIVIYDGVDEFFGPVREKEMLNQVRHKFSINKKFILSVGAIEPRKNLKNLLEAYSILDEKSDFTLVVAGYFGWLYKDIVEKVRKLNLQERVIFTNYVSKEDLLYLYNTCEVFVFPSFYEGFGFPVLEAMKCGAPTITSNTSSLIELFGDVCYLVDPHSPEYIVDGIKKVLFDNALRQELIAKGLERSKEFTWESTAEKTLNLYRNLLS